MTGGYGDIFRRDLIEIEFPRQIEDQVVDVAPIASSSGSHWIVLTARNELYELDAETGKAEKLAVCSEPEIQEDTRFGQLRLRLHIDSNGEFAAVVNDFGRSGELIDLRTGEEILSLDGGDYLYETVPFSCSFAEIGGKTVLLHRTDWNRLDFSDASNGELLTARTLPDRTKKDHESEHDLDYFHGSIYLSPNGDRVLDDGWVWHPFGVPSAWNIVHWLTANPWESEDGPSRVNLCWRSYYWNHGMTWIDNHTIAIEGIGDDDSNIVSGARIFDTTVKTNITSFGDSDESGVREINQFKGPSGKFLSDGKDLFSSNEMGLSRWSYREGSLTGFIPGFQPEHFHSGAREFVQLCENTFIRLRI
ncbi:MAG: hypothetical protein HKN33_18530 [Pyrinomonadaceae bacterium]|nr:hypothetical protein [Pyrinomonadaceae bacterium]